MGDHKFCVCSSYICNVLWLCTICYLIYIKAPTFCYTDLSLLSHYWMVECFLFLKVGKGYCFLG